MHVGQLIYFLYTLASLAQHTTPVQESPPSLTCIEMYYSNKIDHKRLNSNTNFVSCVRLVYHKNESFRYYVSITEPRGKKSTVTGEGAVAPKSTVCHYPRLSFD